MTPCMLNRAFDSMNRVLHLEHLSQVNVVGDTKLVQGYSRLLRQRLDRSVQSMP
jgi:hypothetical protein